MRTLKKALCMVLVLSMMLGLCAIGTSAAATETINYKEAVSVMKALNVMTGDANGFRPQGGLKRSEACRIVVALLGDDDIAVTTANPFSDVPETEWYAKYVAYCAARGYVGGVGDGRFAPDSPLTGYAWALILLRVLGYDPAAEGIGGDDWTIDVASFMKKNEIKLNDGIDVFGLNALNREEAAQCTFNALFQEVVKYTGGSTMNIAGVPVTTDAKCEGTEKTLAQTYFEGFVDAASTDDAGRPAKLWKLGKKTVATIVDAPVYTTNVEMTADQVTKALVTDLKLTFDGAPSAIDSAAKIAAKTGNGKSVEIFADATTKKLTQVVVTEDALVTVAGVTSTPATRLHGANTYYTFSDGKAAITVYSSVVDEDEDIDTGVVAAGIKAGDKVLYTTSTCAVPVAVGDSTATKTSEPVVTVPATVKGAVTNYISATKSYMINGKAYVVSGCGSLAVTTNSKVEKEFYLDSFGNLLAEADSTVASTAKYVMVLGAEEEYTLSGSSLTRTIYATAAGADGKVTKYPVTNAVKDLAAGIYKLPAANPSTGLYTFGAKVTSGVTEDHVSKITNYTAKSNVLGGGLYAGNNTLFIYADYKDGKLTGTVTMMTVANNRDIKDRTVSGTTVTMEGYAVDADNNSVAEVVFVCTASVDPIPEGLVKNVYIVGAQGEADGVWTYNAIVDGAETTVQTQKAGLTAGFYDEIAFATGEYAPATLTNKVVANMSGFLGLGTGNTAAIDATYKVSNDVPVYVVNATTGKPVIGWKTTFADMGTMGGTNGNDSVKIVANGDNVVSAIYVILNDA